MMKRLMLLACSISFVMGGSAQVLKKMANAARARVEGKAVQKTEETVDYILSGKTGKNDTTVLPATQNKIEGNAAQQSTTFTTYSRFDFVPGEKVMVFEDFSQAQVGDFPAQWNTNAGGEIVKLSGETGNWIRLNSTGVYMPEYITNLPENCTLEFDLICNPEFRYSASPLFFSIASLQNPKDYLVWQEGYGGRKGFLTWVLPTSSTGKTGKAGYRSYTDNGETWAESETGKFHAPTKNKVKVSIWRQKQRVRVYLDEEKILDIARGLDPGDYNALIFSLTTQKTAPDAYFVSNIRLAVGAPDTRNKLLSQGKFVTTGILFDVASDKILAPSYGVLKEIAAALQSDPSAQIKIIGHTDSDGDASVNKDLSVRRAAAVKKILANEFGINDDRMQATGKGESEPISDNNTAAGKAQNRRVEFVRK